MGLFQCFELGTYWDNGKEKRKLEKRKLLFRVIFLGFRVGGLGDKSSELEPKLLKREVMRGLYNHLYSACRV